MPQGVYKHKPHTEEWKKWMSKNSPRYWLGKKRPPFSEECKNKMRKRMIGNKINLGRKMPDDEKRQRSISAKKTWTEERKKQYSEYNKKIGKNPPINIGEKNNMWKGGITPENQKIRHSIESTLWRNSVFARDNWTCQKCSIKGGKLHSHHIQNFAQYPGLRFAIDNGITLCRKCHILFHKIYKKRNNTLEQITKYINNALAS